MCMYDIYISIDTDDFRESYEYLSYAYRHHIHKSVTHSLNVHVYMYLSYTALRSSVFVLV